jgi:hypothetical protein
LKSIRNPTASDPGFSDRTVSAPESVSRTIAVVIPSRLGRRADGELFLNQAIAAARGQVVSENIRLEFYVGIDADAEVSPDYASLPGVTFIRSRGRGQSAAINAAAAAAATKDHNFIALLEDDDRWEPNFLAWTLSFLETCDFASSNQLEIDDEDHAIRVNDFPTPSGWIMSAELWRHIGGFDESLRWHVDNDWLGRLAMSGARRIHLVEATAPVTAENCAQVRPWIANVLNLGGPHSAVRRHLSSQPLVRRTVHSGSGMYKIAASPAALAESQNEYRQLVARYGRVPW